jgi:glucokinase
VADIGGTNARFQLHGLDKSSGASRLRAEHTYPTQSFPTFQACLDAFLLLADSGKPDAACLAVAGPVSDNRCTLTNVSGWTIDARLLRDAWGTPACRVINDFEAVGYGVLHLEAHETLTLNEAPAVAGAPIAVLGPGTGLGQALLTWDETAGSYKVWPSEGAHGDFAPVGDTQRALAAWVEQQTGECEIEQVCCGAGIVRIYDFLRAQPGATAAHGGLSPADVTERALADSCPVAGEAVRTFLSILGAESANLALKAMARGGVYLAGGIPTRLLPLFRAGDKSLQRAFLRPSCRFAPVRASMPLKLVLAADPGLKGALFVAKQELGRTRAA